MERGENIYTKLLLHGIETVGHWSHSGMGLMTFAKVFDRDSDFVKHLLHYKKESSFGQPWKSKSSRKTFLCAYFGAYHRSRPDPMTCALRSRELFSTHSQSRRIIPTGGGKRGQVLLFFSNRAVTRAPANSDLFSQCFCTRIFCSQWVSKQ